MAVRFYDEALVNKIQKWIKDPKMRVFKPDEITNMIQVRADQNDDMPFKLPFVAVYREPSIEMLSTNKKPLSFDGMKLDTNEIGSIHLNAIPIVLRYQIDIYTRYFAEGDEYLRNFVFNLTNYPKLTILIPYNDINLSYDVNFRMIPTLEDTSNIPQRLVPGQFTRWTIEIEVFDAYLFSVPFMQNINVEADVDLIEDL